MYLKYIWGISGVYLGVHNADEFWALKIFLVDLEMQSMKSKFSKKKTSILFYFYKFRHNTILSKSIKWFWVKKWNFSFWPFIVKQNKWGKKYLEWWDINEE